ncbi:MAG TPA: hypothetical protein VF951_07730, partial [Streptosporangiaceae bacterium]
FLGLLPFVALTGPVAIPALVRLGRAPAKVIRPGEPPAHADDAGHRLIDGVGVAVAAGLVLTGLTLAVGSATSEAPAGARASGAAGVPGPLSVAAGCALFAAGCALGVPVLRRLMPAGTLSARYGLPATTLSRALLTFCFFGTDAFVTLTITILRHRTPVLAGLAVTGPALTWTAGSWIQARANARWQGRRLVRIGLVIILAGIAGLSAMLRTDVPVAVGIVAWTVAGLGMGLSYSPITLLMLAEAPAGREGWASASLNLADVLGSALGIGIGGAAISAAVRFGWSLSAGLAVAFAITAAGGVLALAISRRLPSRIAAGSAAGSSAEPRVSSAEPRVSSAAAPAAPGAPGTPGAPGRPGDGSHDRAGHADQVGGR